MDFIFSPYWVLFAAGWLIVNGILHDIFVVLKHKGPYDRDLLRLLTDGHVLIFSGAIFLACFFMMRAHLYYGAITGIITSAGMIIYCGLIFPFLKSFGTLIISIMALLVSIYDAANRN